MHIVAKLRSSSKLQIKLYRIADGYTKVAGKSDSDSERAQKKVGRALDSVLESRKVLAFNSPVQSPKVAELSAQSGKIFSQEKNDVGIDLVEPMGEYCVIPSVIEYACIEPDGYSYRVKEEYERISGQIKRSLDLLSKSQQQEKKHTSWGAKQTPKKFRWQGAERIRDSGAVIDRFVGKCNSSMITLTLPGGTEQAKEAVSRWSGWIVNRIMQVIRRVPKNYPPVHWFFVWEHQKRGALHLHLCLAWKVEASLRKGLGLRIKDKWFECLLELKFRDNVDCFQPLGFRPSWRYHREVWQWDYQEIKKSVAAYFSKYCQKNAEINGGSCNKGAEARENRANSKAAKIGRHPIYYPSRYWGSSQSIKAWVKLLTQTMKIDSYSKEETDRIYRNILSASMHCQEVESVTETEFQVLDQKTGVCISSGITVTFCIPFEQYPLFWFRCMQNVFDREVCMDAMMEEFLGASLFASMQET